MNPELQQIAIAKAVGITKIKEGWGWYQQVEMPGDMPFHVKIPDYLNDLSEMQVVVSELSAADRSAYIRILIPLLFPRNHLFEGIYEFSPDGLFVFHMTTPAECAEAFLKFRGLWVED